MKWAFDSGISSAIMIRNKVRVFEGAVVAAACKLTAFVRESSFLPLPFHFLWSFLCSSQGKSQYDITKFIHTRPVSSLPFFVNLFSPPPYSCHCSESLKPTPSTLLDPKRVIVPCAAS